VTSPLETRRAWPLRPAALVALLVALGATAAAAIGTHKIVEDQEDRLLAGRATEVKLVLDSAVDAIPTGLRSQGDILRATDGSTRAYEQAARGAVTAGGGTLTFAWLRPDAAGGYRVVAAAGDGLTTGQVVADPERVEVFDGVMQTRDMMATPLMGSGSDRRLGFAIGPPAAPPGTALYQETKLGPLSPPRDAGTSPFAELDVVVYGSPTVAPDQALTATTPDLPLSGGDVRNVPLSAGATEWLLSVAPRTPLVGNVAASAWWVVLIAGLLGSLLIAAVIETVARRRDAALALYASEHEAAETLQRRLLPQLPSISGLSLAARYLAGGNGQQVGGDWFDAFPIAGGGVGVVIGDVIGHDLAAASAMSQVRSALRAYAVDGDRPCEVVNRLDHLVTVLGLTQLVTVVYGVLEAPEDDGSRMFRYTNAGHLAPLLRRPDGQVESLEDGTSILIGAPMDVDHTEGERMLAAGSTLLLFTDGLVEVPRRPLEETTDEVVEALAQQPDSLDLDGLCDRVLATTAGRELRDDVALLAIRIDSDGSPMVELESGAVSARRA
jgi:hypothetical protein